MLSWATCRVSAMIGWVTDSVNDIEEDEQHDDRPQAPLTASSLMAWPAAAK